MGQGRLRRLQGFRDGYIIISVNDRAVNSAGDIQKIVDGVEARGRILLNVVNPNNGEVLYYVLGK
jgi:S1-C subfamily serine protease